MDAVFDGMKGSRVLDFVAAWYELAARFMESFGSHTRAAFVSTNSISQGEQVPALWPSLLERGVKIDFAHRTFDWSSDARGRAHVHVVIVGFSMAHVPSKPVVYDSAPGKEARIDTTSINPYLLPGDAIVVTKRRTPLVHWVPTAKEGSKPAEGGALIVESDDFDEAMRDEIAAKYLRPLVGGTEMLNGIKRWCLWLPDATPSDLRNSPFIRGRLAACRDNRLKSKKLATQRLADFPALFAEIRQPEDDYLVIPYVSSERRRYIPMNRFPATTIVRAPHTAIAGADDFVFGCLASSAFRCWVQTVSGRLKSDFQIAAGTVYNTFPFPERSALIADAGRGVLDARAGFSDSTLADLYDPLSMPKSLRDAHTSLDAAVDRGISGETPSNDTERLAALFARYEELLRSEGAN